MKKGALAAVILGSLILLAGCSSSEYKESMKSGLNAFNLGDYPTAIAAYEKALEEKPGDSEAKDNLEIVQAKYFETLYAEGTEALDAKNFSVAKTMLTQAYELNPTGEEDLLEELTMAQELDKKQTELDAYAKWLSEASQHNYDLLKEWRTISDNYSIGTMGLEEFTKRTKAMLSKSNDLLALAEAKILDVSGELASAHTDYLRDIQSNHDAIHNTILATRKEGQDPQKIIATGRSIASIQIQQSNHIQSLKSYAKSEGITFTEK